MCGGIAAGLATSARGSLLARQLQFNGGRIASYAIAGAAAGLAGNLLQVAGPALYVQAALFALANALLVMLGLYVGGWGRAVLRLESAGRFLWRRIEPGARRFFPIDSAGKALGAGALWGWVPCGLVYSVAALALASGSAPAGAAVMLAFGLGTLPALMAAGIGAQRLAAMRRAPWVRHGAGMLLVAMGVAGLARVPGLREAVLAGWACLG
jgi:hypothetical protein